jgi:hypothetical protein
VHAFHLHFYDSQYKMPYVLDAVLLAQHGPATAKAIVDADLNQMYGLLKAENSDLQIRVLQVLAALATMAPELSPRILDAALLASIKLWPVAPTRRPSSKSARC